MAAFQVDPCLIEYLIQVITKLIDLANLLVFSIIMYSLLKTLYTVVIFNWDCMHRLHRQWGLVVLPT